MQENLGQAVLKTLIYSDIFDFPLRISEVHRYLIGLRCLEEELSKLLYTNNTNVNESARMKIREWQGYFYLGDKKWMATQRIKREKIAQEKLEKAKKLTAFLKIIPWIKLVAVTGRVAALNCEKEDDIDLLLVTERNRLWLSRVCEWFLLTLLNRRRRPYQTQNLKDKLCPNLYISEENLEFPHQDLFTANELVRMKVVWEKNGTYQELIKTNFWVEKFLPNWWNLVAEKVENREQRTVLEGRKPRTEKEQSPFSTFSLLERLARFLQLKYMKKHQTTEFVRNNLLMFHPRNMRENVLQEYQKRVALIENQ